MRSGWNASKSSSFSPVPANRIGLPTTSFTESAAPPRASPSILVRITPVRPTASSNSVATFTASWPVIASTTSRVSLGFTRVADLAQLVHELGVDLQTTGGVDDHDVASEARRFFERASRHAHRVGGLGVHRHVDPLAEHAQLLDRGGPLEVGAHEQRPPPLAA